MNFSLGDILESAFTTESYFLFSFINLTLDPG